MSKKFIIIAAAGALILILLSVGITWWLLRPEPATPNPEDMDLEHQSQTAIRGPAVYFPMQPAFVVNYPVGNRVRFLQLELSVLARDHETISVLNMHMPLVRNNILISLQGQDVQSLLTDEGKNQLQQDLTDVIQEVVMQQIGRPGVENVLFINFVIQ